MRTSNVVLEYRILKARAGKFSIKISLPNCRNLLSVVIFSNSTYYLPMFSNYMSPPILPRSVSSLSNFSMGCMADSENFVIEFFLYECPLCNFIMSEFYFVTLAVST